MTENTPAITSRAIREAFDVDAVAGRMYWKRPSKYHKRLTGREAGIARAASKSGKRYWVIKWNGIACKRGRLIYCFVHGHMPSPFLDHINGNSLDDRKVNLREATRTENAWNHKKRKKRSTLPMGVRIVKSGRFQARLACNKKMLHLGTFPTPLGARRKYLEKRRELYGRFA